jgi:hypothetical protein
VRLQDEWEKVKIRFTVFHPKFNNDDKMYLIADHRDLKKQGQLKMERSVRSYDWFEEKYGENVQPFETTVLLNQIPTADGINNTNQVDFNYQYKFVLGSRGAESSERFPMRQFDVKNPSKYEGFLGHTKVDY